MKNLKKVLIPIDFSLVAENAVRYAISILENHLTKVMLVYVNTPDNTLEEATIQRSFTEFASQVLQQAHFQYNFEILNGNLLPELVQAAERHQPDLLIMGTQENRQSDISLATALVRSVYSPVLVVPANYKKYRIRKIAYANDYQPIRESFVLKPLWEFAREFQAKVYLLHVNQKHIETLVPADAAESSLEYYLESIPHEWVYLAGDDLPETINGYLHDHGLDLLVILARDHGHNQTGSEGRLIGQLTAHAHIPVLTLC